MEKAQELGGERRKRYFGFAPQTLRSFAEMFGVTSEELSQIAKNVIDWSIARYEPSESGSLTSPDSDLVSASTPLSKRDLELIAREFGFMDDSLSEKINKISQWKVSTYSLKKDRI